MKTWEQMTPEERQLVEALEDLLDQLKTIGIPDWHGAEGLSLEQAQHALRRIKYD